MKKQTNFLLDQIKFLTSKYDLKAKYEYNSDIDIHFVLLYSHTLDLDFVEKISDELYESFVNEFPKSMVAVMDKNNKYQFRFESIFDNIKEEISVCNVEIRKKVSHLALNISESLDFAKYKTVTIDTCNIIDKIANKYNEKVIYKESLSLKNANINKKELVNNLNDEFAFAA
ncbi:hypothetical protein [Chryseobacterium sp. AG844]|uniref:hypothetical protein n=1 Tax=Chryseobacterium sp. AG844 TaxID=2183998 RepID=UPI000D70E2E7|nr:hypothetical protein [Chryseobacterium sp. AG844]PWW25398.1 hypothetical protein DEU40_112130 [Chryseobacterium sp. AG844]